VPIFVSLLPRLLVVGTLVIASVVLALGQEMSLEQRDRIEANREWSALAKGRTEFEVPDPALLPSRLVLAAKHAGCKFEEEIEKTPVRFMKFGSRRLGIVFCPSIVGSHYVFDLSTLQKPRLIELPFATAPEGFGTTVRPGWITREKETSIFQAVTGTDMLPSWDTRHTYRFDENRGFVVIRVEVQRTPGPPEWITIWEAPRWSLPEAKQ
jgi:hypothetical protein